MAKKKGSPVTERTITPLLAAIALATIAGGSAYASKEQATTDGLFTDPALVEINEGMVNPANPAEFAARATAAGIALYQASNPAPADAVLQPDPAPATPAAAAPAPAPAPATPAAPTAPQTFTLDSNVPLAAIRRIHGGDSKYPFEEMAVGQSFFVGATKDNETPAKGLASTVSNVNRKYGTDKKDAAGAPIMRDGYNRVKNATTGKIEKVTTKVPELEYSRFFVVRSVDETAAGRGKGARVWRQS